MAGRGHGTPADAAGSTLPVALDRHRAAAPAHRGTYDSRPWGRTPRAEPGQPQRGGENLDAYVDYRRATAAPRRMRAGASPLASGDSLHYPGPGCLHHRGRRTLPDAARGPGADPLLDLARPRQRLHRTDDLDGWPGYSLGPLAGNHVLRDLPGRPSNLAKTHWRCAAALWHEWPQAGLDQSTSRPAAPGALSLGADARCPAAPCRGRRQPVRRRGYGIYQPGHGVCGVAHHRLLDP